MGSRARRKQHFLQLRERLRPGVPPKLAIATARVRRANLRGDKPFLPWCRQYPSDRSQIKRWAGGERMLRLEFPMNSSSCGPVEKADVVSRPVVQAEMLDALTGDSSFAVRQPDQERQPRKL